MKALTLLSTLPTQRDEWEKRSTFGFTVVIQVTSEIPGFF